MFKFLSYSLLSAGFAICLQSIVASEADWKLEEGIEGFHFQTDSMAGVLVARDTRELGRGFGKHGIREFTYKGHDLNAPEPPVGCKRRHQGLLNLYRVYSSTESFGSLRDDQAELEKLKDGARLTWPASSDRPVKITGTWRVTGSAHIDLHVEAVPTEPIKNFEILPAVYLPVHMTKALYLTGDNGPAIYEVRPSEAFGDALNYAFFPLGEKARWAQKNSGRIHSSWKWKSVVPNDVAALPIVFAEDESLQVILMADPESISAVCATPLPFDSDPTDWNSVEQHSALYFSIFGHDVEPGRTYTSRMRLQVIDRPEDTIKTHNLLYHLFQAETH